MTHHAWLASLWGLALVAHGSAMGHPTHGPKDDASSLGQVFAPLGYAGENGFAELYALGRPTPVDQREAALREDVARFERLLASGQGRWRDAMSAQPRTPQDPADPSHWCRFEAGQPCLADVRANPQAFVAQIERHEGVLDQASQLERFGHFQNPFALHHAMPLPNYQPLGWLPTRHAVWFIEGHTQRALTGTCRGLKVGRTLLEQGDFHEGSLVGAVMVTQHATLLAEMLAELPAEHALPETCQSVLAQPLNTEAAVCRAITGAGRLVLSPLVGGALATRARNEGAEGHLDADRTIERLARSYAWFCGAAVEQSILGDVPVPDAPTATAAQTAEECQDNATGCAFADMGGTVSGSEAQRLQDTAAIWQATQWLVRHRSGNLNEGATGTSRATVANGQLHVMLFQHSRSSASGFHWSVPLPGSAAP